MPKKHIIGIGIFLLLLVGPVTAKLNVVWPTENPPMDMHDSFHALLQPTESNETQSGNFGCVRTNGTQFHEGIDLRAFSRDGRGEATDKVLSVLPGVVVYTNASRGLSSYGRYILVEHSDGEMDFLTLYAHLKSIAPGIKRGKVVEAGQRIATMGRSASYTIPKHRAHLHFEVCLRLTDRFQSWYNWKKFDGKNDHGIFNGMNLVGLDPVHFFDQTLWSHADRIRTVLESEKTAFTVLVSTSKIPDFVQRYPALVDGIIPENRLAGWRIEFTWYGAPIKWTPLISAKGEMEEGKIALEDFDKSVIASDGCRGMLRFRDGQPTIGPGLQTSLQLLFGFR